MLYTNPVLTQKVRVPHDSSILLDSATYAAARRRLCLSRWPSMIMLPGFDLLGTDYRRMYKCSDGCAMI